MKTFIFSSFQIAVAFFTALFFASCHFSDPVPLPVEFTSFPQPQMQPLRLSNPVQLRWDTLAHTLIQPAVFPLDFKNLNGQDYDPNGFKTLPTSPLQLPFNFPGSPSRPFNFKRIVEYPLKMETKVMPLPASATKFQKPERVTAATMDTKEWQQISGLNLIIRGMTTDTSGMIWFGTSNGIYRFDGIQLANFLPGTSINGLCFDKEGNLWCLDQSNLAQAAILKFDFRKGTLGKAYFNFSANGGFVLMQADPSGYIVIAGSSAMPFPVLLDPVKNSYRILNALAGFKSAGYFRGIIDRDNRFWLGSVNGIEVIDRNSDKVYQITRSEGLSHDTVTCIASGKDRRIWAAVPGGVDMFDLKAKRITQYKFRNSGSLYHCMLVDDEGQLWLGGDDGIDILNPSNNTFRHAGPAEGLAWPSVSEFLEDNTGQIMAAGSNGSFFTIYFISQFGKTVYPFGNTNIISAAEDSRGHLWVGTDKGLFVVDSLRRYFRRLSTADGIAGSEIGAITKKEGSIVITTNNGYNIYEPDKGQLFRVGKGEGLLRDTVSSETTDADGNEWITGGFSGITKYDALHRVALSLNARGGLNGNTIIQTMQLNNNKMLVLPEESGPSIIDLAHNTIQTIKGYKGINSFTGKRMIRDSAGRIWISGQLNGWGVYMIDSGLKTISRFTKREGLSDDAVFSVSEFRGRILVAANEKVNIITPPDISGNQKWHVQVMAKSEDLKKSYRNVMADAVTKSGNYLWSDAGLKVIYGIFPDTSQSRNFISGIAIMGKQMQFNDSSEIHLTNAFGKMSKVFLSKLGYEAPGKIHWEKLSVPFNIPENLSVPDKENVIRFQFTELSSGRQDSVNFAYVLEGIDKKWTITNESQTDSYLNLTPGNYNFKVTSRWINGRWNTPTSFQFTIRPPWYGTWWAYIVYAILLLTAILGINRVQRNMVIAKERQRSRIREAQLKAEAENDRRKNAELISEMGRDITSSLSIKNIINTVYNHVNKLMDASVFGIGIYDREKNRIEFPATKENGAILPRYHYQLDDNRRPAVWCFNNKKELFMNDFEKEHTNYISEIAEAAAGKNAESVIYLPLIYKDRGIGVITAQSFSKNSFNEYHLNILRSLASYIVVALDNAETYKKLQSAQTQLVRSEKMASLGELAAGIAHEIQNPLNFVNNFSEINREIISDMREEIKKGNLEEISLLADNIDTNEERIIHHGHRADAIVKSMLQHTRGTTGQKEPTDINALADEYLRLSYHGMRARDKSFNSDYQTDFDKSLSADISGKGKIDVVPQEIGRVLLNLLNNAFYAVNEKKNKENGKYSPSVLVRTKDFSNRVEIGVKDNGSGIPEKILEKIFQPFFTTKPTGSGTGLGLSLSYDIVKAHGGEIEVNSEENEGATFTIILPKSK